MAYEFKMQRTVEFVDTDMAGILHFSNYFRYMESVEHKFFRSLGLKVHTQCESGVRGWARGRTECTFLRPLCYEDVVELHLLVREKKSKSITYLIVFRKQELDGADGPPAMTEVARGSLTVVCVSRLHGPDSYQATEMSAEVDAKIEVAPSELLASC